MLPIVLFTREEELKELTGLSHQALWDNGFNLDDWNWGIQSMQSLREFKYYNHNDNECLRDSPDFCYEETIWKEGYERFFEKLSLWEDFECVEYDGKYYYISYH